MKLDLIDCKLLNYLQENNKLTNKQLSGLLHLSSTAIHERIKKLERSGVIDKYVAIVNRKKIDKNLMVLCEIKLTQHTQQIIQKFEKAVVQLTEVSECLLISGNYDYLLKVHVKDMDTFRNFIATKLTTLPHIGSTHSNFVIGEIKNETAIKMEGEMRIE